MKTILITSQKGGSGKTTLARNLAVAASTGGKRVLCLDLDPQSSLRAWWASREADEPSMLEADPNPAALGKTLKAAATAFDLAVIDTPPAAPAWLADSMAEADLVLIPVRPSPDDLRAVGATVAAVTAASVPFAFVLSQTPRAKITDEAARVLAQYGRVAPVNVATRVIYAESGATGAGVTETADARAKDEISGLWAYVERLL